MTDLLLMMEPGPHAYQLLHPWHWLTYGNNSSGVSTLSAVVAATAALVTLALVYRYTLDNSKSTKITAESYRQSIRPRLRIERPSITPDDLVTFIVTNIGKGQAESAYCMAYEMDLAGGPDPEGKVENFVTGATIGSISIDRPGEMMLLLDRGKRYLLILNYKDVDGNAYETKDGYLRPLNKYAIRYV